MPNFTDGPTTDHTWPENAQEHNDFIDWQYEAANGDTVLGFRDWIAHRNESLDLVCIVFMQGQDYQEAVDAANERGGSTDAVVEHLAQWDYGSENDGAAEVNGYTTVSELRHQVHQVEHGGLHYWLQLDHHLGIYGLYRRRLDQDGSLSVT